MNTIRKTDQWLDTPVRDEVLMMHGETGKFMALNESAGLIWTALDRPRSRDELLDELVAAFAIDRATAGADLDECLAELERQGAIAVEQG